MLVFMLTTMTSYQSNLSLSRAELSFKLISDPSLSTCLLWSPCDKYLFVSEGSHILQFEANNGSITNKLIGHNDEVICLAMHPCNSQQIFSASRDGIICIWDLQDLILLHTVDVARKIKSIAFINLNCYILFANGDVFCLPAKSFSRIGQEKLEKHLTRKDPLITSVLSKELVTFSTCEGNEWLITSSEKILMIYSAQNEELQSYKQKYIITKIAILSSKPILSFGDARGSIFIWHEFTRGDITLTCVHWHSHAVSALGFTVDGSYLLSGGEEGVLVVWQLETLTKQFRPRLGCGICHLKSSNSDNKIALCSEDNSIKVLNSSNLELSFISQNLKRSKWPRFLTPCESLESLILHSSPPGNYISSFLMTKSLIDA